MTTLQVFQYGSKGLRSFMIDGVAWFVASDVAKILGYSATSAMTRRLDSDDKGVRSLHTLGGTQEFTVISQYGVFDAILGSKVDGARRIKKWITHEVLPAITQTGSYSVAPAPTMAVDLNDPAFQRQIVQVASAVLDRAEAAEAQLAIAAPKAAVLDTIVANGEEFDVRTAAQMLQNQVGIKLGQKRLFAWLRDREWIDDDNQPYQRFVEQEVLTVKLSTSGHWSRGEWVEHLPTLLITAKGLAKIHERMVKELNAPAPLSLVAKPKAQNRSGLSLETTYRKQQSKSVRKKRIA